MRRNRPFSYGNGLDEKTAWFAAINRGESLDRRFIVRWPVNGGVVGLTRSLVEELKPIRVNSIHPGVVGDSPFWAPKSAAVEHYTSQTPTGRLASMEEIVDATAFLLENRAVNGVDLIVDGGWHCR